MQVSKAASIWLDYHRSNSKPSTAKAYEVISSKFCIQFGELNLDELTSDQVLSFLNRLTEGLKQETRRTRYSHLSAFFIFFRNDIDHDFINPTDNPMIKKLFRAKYTAHWNTIDKDVIDEIIFKTSEPRNRLMLELMARAGMRIGEVLKLRVCDIHDRKLTLHEPKSGQERNLSSFRRKWRSV